MQNWSVGQSVRGFHVPYNDMKFQARYVRDLGDNRYYVSSFSAPNKEEESVASRGHLRVPIGRDATVCKHQHTPQQCS